MEFQIGQMVRFADPLNSDEAVARFVVVEMRGPRVLLEMVSDFDWALKPQAVHLVADMVLA